MGKELAVIRETLHALSGQLAAYEMLCQALIAAHSDRSRLLDAFTRAAQQADAVFGKNLDEPARLRVYFDAAYDQIVSALRPPGGV